MYAIKDDGLMVTVNLDSVDLDLLISALSKFDVKNDGDFENACIKQCLCNTMETAFKALREKLGGER